MQTTRLAAAAISACLLAPTLLLHAQYTAYDLGPGIAYGINNSGTVVGQSGSGHAVIFNGGGMTDLGVGAAFAINNSGTVVGGTDGSIQASGSAFSYSASGMIYFTSGNAYGINDSGTIVGTTSSGQAFSYSGGVITLLTGSVAYGINNFGTIVGQSGSGQAFSYSGGVTTFFGFHATALGINNSGTVVGYGNGAAPEDSVQAFSYSSGVMTYLGTPTLGDTAARGVNNAGTIVGNNESHAFVYNDGLMTDLSPYLASIGLTGLSEATAINDNGDIVGLGFTASGQRDAFLLVVPEPSTWALLALGVVGLACRTLRNRHPPCCLPAR